MTRTHSTAGGRTATNYRVFMKAGGLRNGAERGHGSIFHAVKALRSEAWMDATDPSPSLCGARPAIQWSSSTPIGQDVTCPKCRAALKTAGGCE